MIKRVFPQIIDFGSKAPEKYRSNFRNLYADVAWFGILNGSTIAFLPIYVTRLGAEPGSVGILTAAPAIVALFISLPLGVWFSRKNTSRAVFLTAVASRIFYLFLCIYPWIFPQSQPQIVTILLSVFIMSIPGTALNLGFNALLGEAVPIEWRGQVAGIRGAFIALATAVSSLACGWILNHIDFPIGYQVVFLIGFIGAAMSTYALWKVRPFPEDLVADTTVKDPQSHWIKRMVNLDILKG
ncbi:MAG TPA: MFS transporter, partial [Longilinea sp.]|nr:MFS transporter [Longilinea sp.]